MTLHKLQTNADYKPYCLRCDSFQRMVMVKNGYVCSGCKNILYFNCLRRQPNSIFSENGIGIPEPKFWYVLQDGKLDSRISHVEGDYTLGTWTVVGETHDIVILKKLGVSS